jgi:hypothetical protein
VTGKLEWGKHPDPGPPERPPWRDPARFTTGLGCLAVALMVYQAWAVGYRPGDGAVEYNGASNAGDGTILLLFAALQGLVSLRRQLVASDNPILRWAPVALAVAMVSELTISLQQIELEIDDWVRAGGHGERTTALLVLCIGVGAVVVGTVVATIRNRPWRGRPDRG